MRDQESDDGVRKKARVADELEAGDVLVDGRLVLRPEAANARFEGSLVSSHEEFFEQK